MSDQFRRANERRAQRGATWIDELAIKGRAGNPHLVRSRSGRVYLVEGPNARPVPSGIIAHGLERSFGATRDAPDSEMSGFAPGVPVEVFEGDDGHAFLVIGGERWRLKGLPLSHHVDPRHEAMLARGSTIDLSAANVSSRRLTEALSWRFQLERIRATVRRRGVLGTARAVAGRGRRALKTRSGR